VFCFFGEEEACWLFHATGTVVALYIADFALYQRYCPKATTPSDFADFFEITHDFDDILQETKIFTGLILSLSGWIRGSVDVGRQYVDLLNSIKDDLCPRNEEDVFI
jgi:hypothetical protein